MSRSGEFDPAEAEALLVACHRRCCVCHKFCGSSIELDHIDQSAKGGSDKISNAIPLCFDCHAEVHHYNPSHPRGRKFRPSELRAHRDQWLAICRDRPDIFVVALPRPEAGSLQRLHSELLFNQAMTQTGRGAASPFEVEQFKRMLGDGTFGWIPQNLRSAVEAAYMAIREYNAAFAELTVASVKDDGKAGKRLANARQPIAEAIRILDTTMSSE